VGSKAPNYFWENLKYLNREFPRMKTVFISDQNEDIRKARKLKLNHWQTKSVVKSWEQVHRQMNHPLEFRNGFWFLTIARFVALADYMQQNPNESILQIEGDVWIAPNFPMHLFEKIEMKYAFPLVSNIEGAASTLYVRDAQSADELLRFSERMLQVNPSGTDMTILGDLARNYPRDCLILPSSISQHNSNQVGNFPQDEHFSKNLSRFNGIFDGAQWGSYIFGEDPRNHRGIRLLFNRSSPKEVKPWDFVFSSTNLGFPGVQAKNEVIPIFALHIHSKDIRLFKRGKIAKIWAIRIQQEKGGVRREIILNVLVAQLIRALRRRWKVLISST